MTRASTVPGAPGMSAILERIPGFDLYKLNDIRRLALWGDPDRGVMLEMDVVHGDVDVCTLQLSGVRDLHLPEARLRMPWLSELEIEDIRDRGLEGITYELRDVGASGELSCVCGEVRFIRLGRLRGPDWVEPVWEEAT